MASLGQPLAQAVQPVQLVWSAKWGKGRSSAFTAVAPAEMAAPESSRTFSLLSRLGLGERIIGKGDTADLTAPIDWAAVGERLGRERKLSLDYLRCALEDRELSGAAISAGATAVKKGFWNWTENTVPWKELVHT